MAWLSFTELDKAVVHVIRLASCLWLWFQCVCPLMPSLSAYHLTWLPLPWRWGISSWLLLTLGVGLLLSAVLACRRCRHGSQALSANAHYSKVRQHTPPVNLSMFHLDFGSFRQNYSTLGIVFKGMLWTLFVKVDTSCLEKNLKPGLLSALNDGYHIS